MISVVVSLVLAALLTWAIWFVVSAVRLRRAIRHYKTLFGTAELNLLLDEIKKGGNP